MNGFARVPMPLVIFQKRSAHGTATARQEQTTAHGNSAHQNNIENHKRYYKRQHQHHPYSMLPIIAMIQISLLALLTCSNHLPCEVTMRTTLPAHVVGAQWTNYVIATCVFDQSTATCGTRFGAPFQY
mmetsp:Transcript_3884/g.10611  ORF Transcript_3884/g.10611 Transcript_3884/m.10611 type:complete len:128 (+) Transcript_3884:501-884(+)